MRQRGAGSGESRDHDGRARFGGFRKSTRRLAIKEESSLPNDLDQSLADQQPTAGRQMKIPLQGVAHGRQWFDGAGILILGDPGGTQDGLWFEARDHVECTADLGDRIQAGSGHGSSHHDISFLIRRVRTEGGSGFLVPWERNSEPKLIGI